jgi:beta-N-acetylhexosaminidase
MEMKMSLREKIGQLMVVNSRIYDQQSQFGTLEAFMEKYPIGGFFMADWYFGLTKPKEEVARFIKDAVSQYSAAAKYPLLFVEDYERGAGERFPGYEQMPVEMALGAGQVPQLAYDYEKSIALQARDLGINWLLHPVADLSLNPFHPLINERALSDDPDTAIPLLKQQISGLHDQNVISTLKHFPGDGATARDQHLFTSTNPLGMEEWEASFGRIFRELMEYGAPSVMIGHMTFPAWQKEKHNGSLLPATLSKEVVTGLLKDKLKFKGVVVSDALNMGGFTNHYPTHLESCLECFKAGVDILLWPELEFMDALEARILSGEIPVERLDDAVERVWEMKKRFGLTEKANPAFVPMTDKAISFIEKTGSAIAENAVTLLRTEKNLLPLTAKETKRVMLIVISHTDKTEKYKLTKALLEQRGVETDISFGLSVFDWNWRMEELDKYDRLVFCLENKYMDPVGTAYLKGKEAETAWMANYINRNKVVIISYSNPYYADFYFRNLPVCINAYSSDRFMQEAVVKALFGETGFRGQTPVKPDHPLLG